MIQTYDLPSDDEILLALFTKVHGVFDSKFSLEIIYDDNFEYEPIAVRVFKSGGACWTESRENLLMKIVYFQSLAMTDQGE